MFMEVIMPQLGETVDKGTIIKWHKKKGDAIQKNDILFEIETDKVTMEIPAQASGVLQEILVGEGQSVSIGNCIAKLETALSSTPQTVSPDSAQKEIFNAPKPVSEEPGLSPVVKQLLKKHSINTNNIVGTGSNQRITKKDVLNYIDKLPFTDASSNTKDIQVEPFSSVRSKIADHMVQSKKLSPHVHQGVEINYDNLFTVKRKLQSHLKQTVSLLSIFIQPLVTSLQAYPKLNAWVQDNKLLMHKNINLGIAVDLENNGLVVPVIKNINKLNYSQRLEGLSKSISSAKKGMLKPDDYKEGTFTISNVGHYGTLFTTPIIHQPQVAILSIDGIRKKPCVAVTEHGEEIVVQSIGVVTISFDHRAIDGAYTAAFLRTLKKAIEQIESSPITDKELQHG